MRSNPNGLFKSPSPGGWLLSACIIGVALTAWWARAAGPVQPRPALGRPAAINTIQALSGGAYGQTAPAAAQSGSKPPAVQAAQAAGGGQAAAGSVQPPAQSVAPAALYPIDPPPKCPIYMPPSTMQPDSYACPDCGPLPSADGSYKPCNPCYQYHGGPEIVCASPL